MVAQPYFLWRTTDDLNAPNRGEAGRGYYYSTCIDLLSRGARQKYYLDRVFIGNVLKVSNSAVFSPPDVQHLDEKYHSIATSTSAIPTPLACPLPLAEIVHNRQSA